MRNDPPDLFAYSCLSFMFGYDVNTVDLLRRGLPVACGKRLVAEAGKARAAHKAAIERGG